MIGCLHNQTKAAANYIIEWSLFALLKSGITDKAITGKMVEKIKS